MTFLPPLQLSFTGGAATADARQVGSPVTQEPISTLVSGGDIGSLLNGVNKLVQTVANQNAVLASQYAPAVNSAAFSPAATQPLNSGTRAGNPDGSGPAVGEAVSSFAGIPKIAIYVAAGVVLLLLLVKKGKPV